MKRQQMKHPMQTTTYKLMDEVDKAWIAYIETSNAYEALERTSKDWNEVRAAKELMLKAHRRWRDAE